MKECFSYLKNDRDHLELKVSAGRIILKYDKKEVSSSAFAPQVPKLSIGL